MTGTENRTISDKSGHLEAILKKKTELSVVR
jgi:hypothetical protein